MRVKKMILLLCTLCMCICIFNSEENVKAEQIDANYGIYKEEEGVAVQFLAGTSAKAGMNPVNFVSGIVTPNSSSYDISIYNIGVDKVDQVKLLCKVYKNNGDFITQCSHTFKNVKVGVTKWSWKLQKGETVQETIKITGTARDGSDQTSFAGQTVRYNFVGGKYGSISAYDGHRHHMPSDSVNGLSKTKGPAVRMIISDHKNTASYGNSADAKEFREKERKKVKQGKFLQAQQLGVKDVQKENGNKYNAAINQMIKYTKTTLGYTS